MICVRYWISPAYFFCLIFQVLFTFDGYEKHWIQKVAVKHMNNTLRVPGAQKTQDILLPLCPTPASTKRSSVTRSWSLLKDDKTTLSFFQYLYQFCFEFSTEIWYNLYRFQAVGGCWLFFSSNMNSFTRPYTFQESILKCFVFRYYLYLFETSKELYSTRTVKKRCSISSRLKQIIMFL